MNVRFFLIMAFWCALSALGYSQLPKPSLTEQRPIKEEAKIIRGFQTWSAESSPKVEDVRKDLLPLVEKEIQPTAEGDPFAGKKLTIIKDATALQKLGTRFVGNWKLAYDGLPLTERSNVTCNVAPNGSLSLRKRNLPESAEEALKASTPKAAEGVNEKRVQEVALKKLGELVNKKKRDLDVEKLKPLRDQQPELQIWVDPETKEARLVRRVVLTLNGEANASESFAVYVTVGSADKVDAVGVDDLVHHEYKGRVDGPIWERSQIEGHTTRPIPKVQILKVQDVAEAAPAKTFTDANGQFILAGDGPAKLKAILKSDFFSIVNDAGTVQEIRIDGNDHDEFAFKFSDNDEFNVAQVSAYYWAHAAREFASSILEPTALPAVKVHVNANGECNAFFTQLDKSLTLFRASAQTSSAKCINRAYRDTIFHEYGHAIDFACNGIQDGGYSEGFGDSLAIILKGEACYGHNCCGPMTCLRDATEVVLWPNQADGEVHDQGRVYAGFTWELIQSLQAAGLDEKGAIAKAKELTLAACKSNPISIPNAVELVFEADDDDADLANGSPHFQAIARAADSRKIPRPVDPPSP
jgi:hypothetical protein